MTDAGVALSVERDVGLVFGKVITVPVISGFSFRDLVARDRMAVASLRVAVATQRRVGVVGKNEGCKQKSKFHLLLPIIAASG